MPRRVLIVIQAVCADGDPMQRTVWIVIGEHPYQFIWRDFRRGDLRVAPDGLYSPAIIPLQQQELLRRDIPREQRHSRSGEIVSRLDRSREFVDLQPRRTTRIQQPSRPVGLNVPRRRGHRFVDRPPQAGLLDGTVRQSGQFLKRHRQGFRGLLQKFVRHVEIHSHWGHHSSLHSGFALRALRGEQRLEERNRLAVRQPHDCDPTSIVPRSLTVAHQS